MPSLFEEQAELEEKSIFYYMRKMLTVNIWIITKMSMLASSLLENGVGYLDSLLKDVER